MVKKKSSEKDTQAKPVAITPPVTHKPAASTSKMPGIEKVSVNMASLVEEAKHSAKTATVASPAPVKPVSTPATVNPAIPVTPVVHAKTQPTTAPVAPPAPVSLVAEVSTSSETPSSPVLEPDIRPDTAVETAMKPMPETESLEETMDVQTRFAEPEPAHQIPSMYIIHITPELAPVAKVGGLADVVYGLANEMEIRGNHVEIILPKYDCLRYDHIWGLCQTYSDLWVPWYGGSIHCTVFFGFVHGRKCFFIEPHSGDNFFNRGSVYGFRDDVLRFAFFSRAAMEFLLKSGKSPDIIHCHDWQTGLVPVFLFEIYKYLGMSHPRVCYTIHNFKHQGVTGGQILQATGLNRPEYYAHNDRLRDTGNPHAINLMKGGVVYSNFVTTVSPRHAHEAKDQGQGFGLEPTLHIHQVKFGGVVNGIDYNVWNPEIDGYIPVQYSVGSLDGKYANKRALREHLMLADNEKPIVAFVGRLDPQKGLELLRHAIFYTLQNRGQFILLGSSPDSQINNFFWGLKHQLNDNPDVHIEIGFNEELSHLIYAGSDIMLVPSRFEPCGLTQLIAMKYGSIPVVREVGGLVDTVFDKDFSYKPLHERNGYVFRDYDHSGLESALGRALSCYYDYPEHFRDLIQNAMRYDFSWKNPGQDYINIYDFIREK
ncbi:MAG: glycogen synthase GlgA [Methylococcaceae bacterium]